MRIAEGLEALWSVLRRISRWRGSGSLVEAPATGDPVQRTLNEATPRNVPGPFYAAKGCCMACSMTAEAAPDLIGFDEDAMSCFFRKQPTKPDELDRAIQAVKVSCCGALRYRGSDAQVKLKLVELGASETIEDPDGIVRLGGVAAN